MKSLQHVCSFRKNCIRNCSHNLHLGILYKAPFYHTQDDPTYRFSVYSFLFLIVPAAVTHIYSDTFKNPSPTRHLRHNSNFKVIWGSVRQESHNEEFISTPETNVPHLPTYSVSEVKKHALQDSNGIWVTYGRGVYDITKFIYLHPGGSKKILLASGQALEPFWNVYGQHKQNDVLKILESLRIGNLREEDVYHETNKGETEEKNDDAILKQLHPAMKIHSKKPCNAETDLSLLVDSFYTPTPLFFVRNHLPIPKISPNHILEIGGLGIEKPIQLNVEEIKAKFEHVTISATLQCAGNSRNRLQLENPGKLAGLSWDGGAIGNALWKGVRISDILEYYGIDLQTVKKNNILHIQFDGLDKDMTGECYGASVPIEFCMLKERNAILAFEMNGKPLTIEHGAPMRVIIPGVIGARQVKWLKKITLSEKESDSFWQQNDYKLIPLNKSKEKINWKDFPALAEYPIQSIICTPPNNTQFSKDEEFITLRGYACNGGGRAITRVAVSIDDEKTWVDATLYGTSSNGYLQDGELMQQLKFEDGEESCFYSDWSQVKLLQQYSWIIWSVDIPITPDMRSKTICARCCATDFSGNTQPQSAKAIINARGFFNNSQHRIKLHID